MKKIFILALALFVSFTSIALAKENVKIARLPIIIQQNKLENETALTLEMKMARAVKVPSKIIEYIPPREAAKELNKIWQEMYSNDENVNIIDVIKILADEIDADLVICPLLLNYGQRVPPNPANFKTRLSSFVSAELIIYDRTTGDLIDKTASRKFKDDYNKMGTIAHLSEECFEQLIEDTELRQIIRDKRG